MQDVFAPFLSCVLEPGHLVEMFGCPGSGKTQFSIFLSVKALSRGKNVIYVDTRNDFSVTRFMEMSKKASVARHSFTVMVFFNFQKLL